MGNQTILVDSNVIIYAINRSSPKHEAAQAFLQEHHGQVVLAHQNIMESLRVLTHKKFQNPMTPVAAIRAVGSIAEACHVIAPDWGAYHVALALVKKHELAGDKIFDAYLAAMVLAAGVDVIATDNTKDFSMFEGITLVNPFGVQGR